MARSFSGTNTSREGYELAPMQAGDIVRWTFMWICMSCIRRPFRSRRQSPMGYTMCDWIDNVLPLQMSGAEGQTYRYMHLPCRVEVHTRIRGARHMERQIG
jgi:hypothetical protein